MRSRRQYRAREPERSFGSIGPLIAAAALFALGLSGLLIVMPYNPPAPLQPLVVTSPSAGPLAAYPTTEPAPRVSPVVRTTRTADTPSMPGVPYVIQQSDDEQPEDSPVMAAGGTLDSGVQQLVEPTPTSTPVPTQTAAPDTPTPSQPTETPSPTPSPAVAPENTATPTVEPSPTPTRDFDPGPTGSSGNPNEPVAVFHDPEYEQPSPEPIGTPSHPIHERPRPAAPR